MDQLDGRVSVTVSGLPINTNILRSYTLTYRACDSRPTPNCATITRSVQIVQTAVPVISVLGANRVWVQA